MSACAGRRSVSVPLIGPMQVVPEYGNNNVLLSTMWPVPESEKGQDGRPGTVAVPVTV